MGCMVFSGMGGADGSCCKGNDSVVKKGKGENMVIYRVTTSIGWNSLVNEFTNPEQAVAFADSIVISAVKGEDGKPKVTISLLTDEDIELEQKAKAEKVEKERLEQLQFEKGVDVDA